MNRFSAALLFALGTAYAQQVNAEAVCRQAQAIVLPPMDRPDESQRAALKDCDSRAFYYGFDHSPDSALSVRATTVSRSARHGFVVTSAGSASPSML